LRARSSIARFISTSSPNSTAGATEYEVSFTTMSVAASFARMALTRVVRVSPTYAPRATVATSRTTVTVSCVPKETKVRRAGRVARVT
jgi:hypothetical protein